MRSQEIAMHCNNIQILSIREFQKRVYVYLPHDNIAVDHFWGE